MFQEFHAHGECVELMLQSRKCLALKVYTQTVLFWLHLLQAFQLEEFSHNISWFSYWVYMYNFMQRNPMVLRNEGGGFPLILSGLLACLFLLFPSGGFHIILWFTCICWIYKWKYPMVLKCWGDGSLWTLDRKVYKLTCGWNEGISFDQGCLSIHVQHTFPHTIVRVPGKRLSCSVFQAIIM